MALKAKRMISIDAEILKKISNLTRSKKGGVSGWINDACKKRIRSLDRSTNRRTKIFAARKGEAAK